MRTVCLVLSIVAVLMTAGCAQNTAAPVAQPTDQVQQPITDQAAQGSDTDINLYFLNAPGHNALPSGSSGGMPDVSQLFKPSPFATSQPFVGSTEVSGGDVAVRDTRAGYSQSGFHIAITTGGTTGPQSTGATTSTIQPGANVSQTPTQTPKAAVDVPIAVGVGGSAPNAAASGAVEGNPSTTSSQQADIQATFLRAVAGDQKAWTDLAKLLGIALAPQTGEVPVSGPSN